MDKPFYSGPATGPDEWLVYSGNGNVIAKCWHEDDKCWHEDELSAEDWAAKISHSINCHADLLAALEFYLGGEPGSDFVEYRSPAAVRRVVRKAVAKAKPETKE